MAEEKRPLGTTRTFGTTEGTLSYAELAEKIAPNLVQLLDDIDAHKFRSRTFDPELIQEFHFRIIENLIPDIAGRWRSRPVQVGNWLPPEPFEIPVLISEYTKNLESRLYFATTIDLQIEALAYAEGEFLHIHPFQDFNGRTIRALLRELLHRLNLPIVDTSVAIGSDSAHHYQEALAEYDNGRLQALKDFWYERFDTQN